MLEKATRVLTDEDKEMMDRPIEGKNGELRKIEHILGRSKLKKGFQYEVKFKGLDHKVGHTELFSSFPADGLPSTTRGSPETCWWRRASPSCSANSTTWSRPVKARACVTRPRPR
jgi:hypothetical protein